MHGDQNEASFLQAEPRRNIQVPGAGQLAVESIDHQVADEMNLLLADALAKQVLLPTVLGNEQNIGKRIGHDPIDLLWHSPIERPQAGLQMGDRDVKLGGRKAARQRGVDISGHDNPRRATGNQMVLISLHDPGRLPGMGIGPNLQQDVGGADSELLEEDIGHARVVVLTGMDQADAAAGWGLQRAEQGCDLHEIRPGADNAVDLSRHGTGTSGVRVVRI